ncbi:MAG: hypothetical protein AB8B63_06105 [Granulosicoccus sp.]
MSIDSACSDAQDAYTETFSLQESEHFDGEPTLDYWPKHIMLSGAGSVFDDSLFP